MFFRFRKLQALLYQKVLSSAKKTIVTRPDGSLLREKPSPTSSSTPATSSRSLTAPTNSLPTTIFAKSLFKPSRSFADLLSVPGGNCAGSSNSSTEKPAHLSTRVPVPVASTSVSMPSFVPASSENSKNRFNPNRHQTGL